MKEADLSLKRIVFKACCVAVWADSSMSSDERRYVFLKNGFLVEFILSMAEGLLTMTK